MAEHDRIQIRRLLRKLVHDILRRLLGSAGLRISSQTGVRGHHDHVGPFLLLQFGDGAADRVNRRDEAIGAEIFRALPHRDHGRGDSDYRHFHAADRLYDVGGERAFGAAGGDRSIRGDPGKFRILARLRQIGQPGIVLVIAHRHGVVAQQIHGAHHWVAAQRRGGTVAYRVGAGTRNRLVYAFERRALYGVAAIDQQGVGVAGARFADQGGDFGEAARHRLAGHIVHRDQVSVHVRGGQQGDGDGLRGQQSGSAEKNRDQTTHGMSTRL